MRTHAKEKIEQAIEHSVNLQDVNRLLELGKLLSSILTEEELKALHDVLMSDHAQKCLPSSEKIGNTGVS
jgi:hypothetical protein